MGYRYHTENNGTEIPQASQESQGESASYAALVTRLRVENLALLANRGGIEPIRAIRLMAKMEVQE